MKTYNTRRAFTTLLTLAILFSLIASTVSAAPTFAPPSNVTITILHTNDFHGQLEASGSNPGAARVANVINGVRTAVGAGNVLLVDSGDEMQGSLLSNLGQGYPTIATYNAMGYNAATFGNHEFDWGQTVLGDRTTQATYPYVTANIVKNDTGNCATAGWTKPDFADAAYQLVDVGVPVSVKVAFIGVTTIEVPSITIASATAGLCFKDPADSIVHYYDEMKLAGADVVVVLSHLGFNDGGYGYGIPAYGDKTLAQRLIDAGKPANLIIGGHSHTDLGPLSGTPMPSTLPANYAVVGQTSVVQAMYNGRRVGRADITVNTLGNVSVNWQGLIVNPSGAKDAVIDGIVTGFASDPIYQATVNTPIGYSAVDLPRLAGAADNMMATFVDDAIYNYLNTDGVSGNDIDIFFNNAGGIRTDWCWNGTIWVNTGCAAAPATHAPALLTYGNMFTVLPFGNQTIVGQMTGAQILQVIQMGPNVTNGVIQPAGLKYTYYKYTDANPGPQPWAWGAYDVTVYNKATHAWEPLDLARTYSVGTNEFLAPAGGDGYNAFKYMTNITYWGDMLNAVNAYVTATYGAPGTAYMGPNGDGSLDGRIVRDGTNAGGSIIPLTVLHHNDSHGNLYKGSFVGYTQLATLIKQERLHNPTRTLLLSSGDNIQGDALTYYYRTSPTGFASDGTVLPPALWLNPVMAVMNAMNYDAMVLGNHEFNFGKDVFTSVLGQATFPLLQANVSDDGSYGLATVPNFKTEGYVTKTVGGDIDVAILGIGNHRIPNYELPSNIQGLTFSDPIAKAQELSNLLRPTSDVIIALTHIGFTENPASVEVDANVDTNLVAQTTGLDLVVGGHSHTNPATGFGAYKYLPALVLDASGRPVLTAQAYRYNNTLGEISIGLRSLGGGQYQVVSQAGRYLTVTMSTVEDPATKAIVDPYLTLLNTYTATNIGQTTQPINTTNAYIAETNAANLQADASIYELASHGITDVDFHLSGAMTRPSSQSNWIMFPTATPALPSMMKISDMFTLMPYENSLVVLSMNGPQLKAVLERAYRNYYYYKYVSGYGGYSYYTTCMLDTNSGNQITYNDQNPVYPNGNNVISLVIGGVPVNFNDASAYYNVSTVNYLAAGSCNFNNSGVSLWPLDRIVHDTQYYVRDAVINYATHMGIIGPVLETRLRFVNDVTGPVLNMTNMIVPQITAAGAVVPYTVTATDDYDPSPTVSCAPPSGSTFPVGTTTVNCTATDNMGNVTNGSFTITVAPAVNLLLNPGFDQFNVVPRAWTYSVMQPPLSSLTDCTVFVSPNCSLKLIGSRMTRIVTQIVSKKGVAGDAYSYGIYDKALNLPAAGSYYIQVTFFNSMNRPVASQVVNMAPGTHDFEMVNGTLTVPSAYSRIVFRIYFQKGAGVTWFDNAFLFKLAP